MMRGVDGGRECLVGWERVEAGEGPRENTLDAKESSEFIGSCLSVQERRTMTELSESLMLNVQFDAALGFLVRLTFAVL